MGLLNAFTEWRAASREKKIAKHQAQGTCPDCSGKGYYTVPLTEYSYPGTYEDFQCNGCNGSGMFNDWSTQHQQYS